MCDHLASFSGAKQCSGRLYLWLMIVGKDLPSNVGGKISNDEAGLVFVRDFSSICSNPSAKSCKCSGLEDFFSFR